MIRRSVLALAVITGTASATALRAQQPPPAISGAQFDVVSIKLNTSGEMGGGMRELPDGGFQATNIRIRQIMNAAAPEPVFEHHRPAGLGSDPTVRHHRQAWA